MIKFLRGLSSNVVIYLSAVFAISIVILNVVGIVSFQKFFSFSSLYEFVTIIGSILVIAMISILLFKIRDTKKFVVLLFIIAFVVRYLWIIFVDTYPTSDFKIMYDAALELAKGNYESVFYTGYFSVWVYQLGFTGYLAIILKLFNNSLFVVKFINVIIISFITIIIYFSAKKLVNEKIARIPAILYALYVGSIVNTSVLTNQHLATLLFYLAILLILSDVNRKFRWILVGLFIALGQIIRPEGPIVILALLLFFIFKNINDIKELKKSLLEFCGIVLTISIIIKVVSFGFINAGITQYELSNRDPLWKFVCGFNHDTKGTYSAEDSDYLGQFGGIGSERQKAELELIKERLSQPKKLAITLAYKYTIMWALNDTSLQLSFTENVDKPMLYDISLKLEKIQYIIITVMFMLGIINIIKRKDGFNNNHIYLIIFLGYVLAHLLIEVQTRYRYFALPIFFIIASYSISEKKLKNEF